jgi:hypothetical protein
MNIRSLVPWSRGRSSAGRWALACLIAGLLAALVALGYVLAGVILVSVAGGDTAGLINAINAANADTSNEYIIRLARDSQYIFMNPAVTDADGPTALPPIAAGAHVALPAVW